MSEFNDQNLDIRNNKWKISTVLNEAEIVTDFVANGSFASLKENVTYKNTPDYAILIRMVDFGKSFHGEFVYVDKRSYDFLKKSKLYGGEIIISNVGEYSGTVFRAPKLDRPMTLGPNSIMVNFKNGNDFYYYWFKSPQGQETLQSIRTGSAIPKFNKTDFRNLKIPAPPLHEKERIAEVLSSLDDKIDLLQRQNKTLEEMAETLFRQWFENLENHESTSILNIEDVATVQNGYSFKSSEFITEQFDSIEVLKMGHISVDGGLRPSPKKDFVKRCEKFEKWILNKRDIILAMTDMKDNVVILGVPALIDQDDKYVLNQRVGRIFLKENSAIDSILILYMQMKEKNFISELQSKGNSGVQVNLGTDTIRQTKIIAPAKEFQKKILPQLESIFDKLDINREQIQKLEILRDTLLPKLMSGEVRVKN